MQNEPPITSKELNRAMQYCIDLCLVYTATVELRLKALESILQRRNIMVSQEEIQRVTVDNLSKETWVQWEHYQLEKQKIDKSLSAYKALKLNSFPA
ncbi:MAG: hypothetical protein WBW16_05340 [Bacteroidota bacterium]